MNTFQERKIMFFNKYQKFLFICGSLAILVGFFLSIASWLEVCSQECAPTHKYRLFGLKLEIVGLIFFSLLTFFHFGSLFKSRLSFITAILLGGAVGSELVLIYAQKMWIGQWCKVCLSIAAMVGIVSLTYFMSYLYNLKLDTHDPKRSITMLNVIKGIATTVAIVIGFFMVFFGLTKIDELQAAEDSIRENIFFGNSQSNIDVYFFSDWQCPACRQVEPKLKELTLSILKDAKLTYVDFTIHPASLNFTPYNLSFMINDKDKYLDLRDALTELSILTETPTDEQVEQLANKFNLHYKQLNYADVALGLKYFKNLGKEFEIDSTPTLVLINEKTKKGKKLFGVAEINEENITNAIEKLNED